MPVEQREFVSRSESLRQREEKEVNIAYRKQRP